MTNSDRSNLVKAGNEKTKSIRPIGSLLILLTLGSLCFLFPAGTWLTQGQVLSSELLSFGVAAPLVFVTATITLTILGAPRLLVFSLGGLAFGAGLGLVWSLLGTLLGAYATFLLVRTLGGDAILHRYPKLNRYCHGIPNRGLLTVLLVRQMPMNGLHNNLLLGLSSVKHRDFLLGSTLGYLPLGVAASLVGAGVITGDLTRMVQFLGAGLAFSLIIAFVLKRAIAQHPSGKNLVCEIPEL